MNTKTKMKTNILFWYNLKKCYLKITTCKNLCKHTNYDDIHFFMLKLLLVVVEERESEGRNEVKTIPVTSFNWFNVEPQNVNDVDCCVQSGTINFMRQANEKHEKYVKIRCYYYLLIISTSFFLSLPLSYSFSFHSHNPSSLRMTSATHAHAKEQLYYYHCYRFYSYMNHE